MMQQMGDKFEGLCSSRGATKCGVAGLSSLPPDPFGAISRLQAIFSDALSSLHLANLRSVIDAMVGTLYMQF
jgi:hypothetical protein